MTRKLTYCIVVLAGLTAPWFIDWRAGAIAVAVHLFCVALVPSGQEERWGWFGLQKPAPLATKFYQAAPFEVRLKRDALEGFLIGFGLTLCAAFLLARLRDRLKDGG